MGPFLRLRAAEVGLTWERAPLLPGETMRYVDRIMEQFWAARGLDWKTLAMKNLGDRTNGNPAGVRQFRKQTGELSGIAFMFEDGYGHPDCSSEAACRSDFPRVIESQCRR